MRVTTNTSRRSYCTVNDTSAAIIGLGPTPNIVIRCGTKLTCRPGKIDPISFTGNFFPSKI